VSRAYSVREATRLREAGMTVTAIAKQLGISRSTVSAWINDPDLSKQRKRRRERYSGVCGNCGSLTDGSGGRAAAPKLCSPCQHEKEKAEARWPKEAILAAMREYVERYGELPSGFVWNPALLRSKGRADLAERFNRDGCWPLAITVSWRFGTWNDAMREAGFSTMRQGQTRRRPGREVAA